MTFSVAVVVAISGLAYLVLVLTSRRRLPYPPGPETSPDRWKSIQLAFARGMGHIWEVVQRLRYGTLVAFTTLTRYSAGVFRI
jgi:hypothetical protein